MATIRIKTGDTLSGLAEQHGTTVSTLAGLNGIKDVNKIQAGGSLNLPGETPPAPVAPVRVPGEQTQKQRENVFAATGQRPVVTPAPSAAAISTADLERGTQLPDAGNFADTTSQPDLSGSISKVAETTLTSTGSAIDALLAQRQEDTAAAALAEKAKVEGVEGEIKDLGEDQATAAQDTLADTREKFEVDQTIKDLKMTKTKILAAQEALRLGLIYEADRPARQQLLIGRSASLQKQGLATIGAMQATAEILQGNIDLAESYAKTTIDAITTDNKNAMTALETLLNLHNDNLVTLEGDEKDILDTRIKALQDQEKELANNADDVFDLISKYPSAAAAGGVTLLDDRASALTKMLPKMSERETIKFNASIAATQSAKTDNNGSAENKGELLDLKAGGMTYLEALDGYSDVLSVDWITDVYREASPKTRTPEQQLQDTYYQSFLDPVTGKVKEGFDVTLDEKGNPVVTPTKPEGNFFSRIFSGFNPEDLSK